MFTYVCVMHVRMRIVTDVQILILMFHSEKMSAGAIRPRHADPMRSHSIIPKAKTSSCQPGVKPPEKGSSRRCCMPGGPLRLQLRVALNAAKVLFRLRLGCTPRPRCLGALATLLMVRPHLAQRTDCAQYLGEVDAVVHDDLGLPPNRNRIGCQDPGHFPHRRTGRSVVPKARKSEHLICHHNGLGHTGKRTLTWPSQELLRGSGQAGKGGSSA